MFTSLGLFKKTRCPDIQNCERTTCLFSHSPDAPADPPALEIPIHVSKPYPQPQKDKQKPAPSPFASQIRAIPSKRAASEIQTAVGSAIEPPRKISKVGPSKKPGAIPTSTQTSVSSKSAELRSAICDRQRSIRTYSLAFLCSKYPRLIP